MNKQMVTNRFKDVVKWSSKRSPEILVGIGVAGMVTTTVLAVRATPKALMLIEAERERQTDELHRERYREKEKYTVEDFTDAVELTTLDVVKVAWKPYIPAAVTGVISITCLVGASSVNVKRNAALATAYKLSETALDEFKKKAIETVGEKKVKEIKDGITKDKIDKQPVSKSEVIVTEKGNTLCFEPVSGRYFKSDIENIRKVVNDLNARMISENSIALTEFYVELGLSSTMVSDELGWNLDRRLTVNFSSHIADDGTPCIVIDYKYPPFYDYHKYW